MVEDCQIMEGDEGKGAVQWWRGVGGRAIAEGRSVGGDRMWKQVEDKGILWMRHVQGE